ncbi:MAG: hypothetical protein HC884_05225 [Chloroflexaceae bacterium]|nr:hypothetical protein [Chloroflexaceae bacterium]
MNRCFLAMLVLLSMVLSSLVVFPVPLLTSAPSVPVSPQETPRAHAPSSAEQFRDLAAAPPSSPDRATNQLSLGVNMHPLHDPYDAERTPHLLDQVAGLGVDVVRIDIHWAWIEVFGPGQAGWNPQQIERLTTFLQAAQARDIAVLAVVTETPCWASTDPARVCTATERSYDWRYPPADPQDFAHFLTALAQEYGDDIDYWEIWNEPNIEPFWANPDAAAYTALLQAAYPALKTHDPQAPVLAGSLAPWNGSAEVPDVLTYLDRMYAAGAKGYFDALSYHPYTDGMEPSWYDTRWPMNSYAVSVPAVRERMLQAGDTNPIWLTESGWTTVGDDCSDCWSPELPTTEEEQAAYLVEAVDIAQRWDYVVGYAWYELADRGDSTTTSFEDHFGLFRYDLSPKPAAEQFRELSFTLDNLSPLGTYPAGPYHTGVGYDGTTSTYVFTYTGSYTATYTLNLHDSPVQTGRLRVGAEINDGPMAYPIATGGPRYRRSDGTILEPDDLASLAAISLDSHRLVGDFLRLDYTVTLDGTSHHLRYDLWLRGGTLVWQVSDVSRDTSGWDNFWGFRIGASAATPAAHALTLPYMPDPVAAYGPGSFFSAYLDRGKSHSYRFERVLDEPGGDQVSAYNLGIPEPDSAGRIEPLDETGYLIVSPEIADVLPAPQHEPSPFRPDLNHRLTLDVWGVSGNWHHPWPFDAVRAWTSPVTGRVTITGYAADENPDCGNGVVVSIRHNDLEIWSAVIDNGDATGVEPLLTVDVVTGDTLYFHINHRGENNRCDSTRWQPVITTPDAVYDAALDWSDKQGENNWRYLEYRGANGYQEMTWQDDHWAGTRPYSQLWQTGGHPGEGTNADMFLHFGGLLDSLERYGIRDLNVILHIWQRYGYDIKLPTHYPANPDWGGSEAMRALVNHARATGHRIALHENYVDHYPDAPSFSWDNVAFQADGTPKECWYNPTTDTQAYCTAADKSLPLADEQGQHIVADYAPNAAYEDVDTVIAPWQWIDLDAARPTAHTHAASVRLRKQFFRHQQDQYGGPLSGEGGTGDYAYDPYYAGYVDSVEAQIEGRAGAAIIPDFELRAVQPLQVNQGMGYPRRYFFPTSIENDTNLASVVFTPAQQDRYRAHQIAYGHSGWLDAGFPRLRSSLSDTMTEYYLMRALQTRYLDRHIEHIAYDTNGTWEDLGGALQAGVDLFQPRLRLDYADGTHILVNGEHGAGWYASTEDFSHRQNTHNWRYQFWDGGSYQDMTWNAENRHWQGPATWCRIYQWSLHPDSDCEPALVWSSPVNTTAQVRAWLHDGDHSGGDGVTVTIWHNDQLLWSQAIANADPETYAPNLTVDVVAGDTIALRVNQNSNANWDSTGLSTWITYQDEVDHTWTVAPDGLAGPSLTLPANGWIAWDEADEFIAYTAQQGDGGSVDYSQSADYLFARSRDGSLRSIGNLATDGTAALMSPTQPGGRDLYVTTVSTVAVSGAPILSSSAPFTGSVTYRDADSLVLAADTYPAAQQYTIIYYDLPISWYTPYGMLDGQVRAYNLTDQNIPGTPIAVHSTPQGTVSLDIRSGQRVLLRREAVNTVQPPLHVQVVGPTAGKVGESYPFTATVEPATTTTPISLTWQVNGQADRASPTMILSDTVAYTWQTPGPKAIEVTATNSAGWATGSYSITIDADADLFITSSSPTWLGDTTFFTATVNGSYDRLVWAFGDGTVLTDTGDLHPQHLYAAADIYLVTATLFAGGEVAAEATTTVQVIPEDDDPQQPARIELTAAPTSLQANGRSTAQLVARVLDDRDTPLPGQEVTFTTTLGRLSLDRTVTNDQGEATARLQAGTTVGEAIVTATTGAEPVQASVRVQFRPFEVFLPIIRRP